MIFATGSLEEGRAKKMRRHKNAWSMMVIATRCSSSKMANYNIVFLSCPHVPGALSLPFIIALLLRQSTTQLTFESSVTFDNNGVSASSMPGAWTETRPNSTGVLVGWGGALYNGGLGIVTFKGVATFRGNLAGAGSGGGAVCNDGLLAFLSLSSFTENLATGISSSSSLTTHFLNEQTIAHHVSNLIPKMTEEGTRNL